MSWLFPDSLHVMWLKVSGRMLSVEVQAPGGLLRSPPPPPAVLPIRFSLCLSQFHRISVSAFLWLTFMKVDSNGGCCGTHARHAHAGVGTSLPPVPMHTFGSLAVQYNHALHPNEPLETSQTNTMCHPAKARDATSVSRPWRLDHTGKTRIQLPTQLRPLNRIAPPPPPTHPQAVLECPALRTAFHRK